MQSLASNSVLLTQGYLPPVPWFFAAANAGAVVLEKHEHYQKGSFRNRCEIASANGRLALAVPLRKGKNQQQPIGEVLIAYDEQWQRQHWRAIVSAYSNSPFFEHFSGVFEPFYFSKKYDRLWDWNLDLVLTCFKIMKQKPMLSFTEKYETSPSGILDLRSNFLLSTKPHILKISQLNTLKFLRTGLGSYRT